MSMDHQVTTIEEVLLNGGDQHYDQTAALIVKRLAENGYVIVPKKATENMAGYAKHRNPGVDRTTAKDVWCTMVDEAINGK